MAGSFIWGNASADSFTSTSYQLPDFQFSNRARCAADSKKPSSSAFILLNNVDPARAVYRLALATGHPTESTTKLGIETFRMAVLRMTRLIHDRLITGQLPLIPSQIDSNSAKDLSRFKNIQDDCNLSEDCPGLDDLIAEIWRESSQMNNYPSAQYFNRSFRDIDHFTSEKHFLPDLLGIDPKLPKYKLSCAYLKKFSPLQAHLYGSRPTNQALHAMAESVIKSDEYLASCDDLEAQENLQVAAYQIDLHGISERSWNRHGHDYWNSLRLYLSWAFRFAPEMEQMAFPFSHVFRRVALEDAVMLIPNGCKSLTPPECDHSQLAMNSMREFAKNDYRRNAIELDFLTPLPDGPTQDLLDAPIPAVNRDILDLADHDTSADWLNQFRENMAATRNHHRTQMIKAHSFMHIFTAKIGVEQLKEELDAQFEYVLGLVNSPERKTLSDKKLQELYYLCSEFSLSQHETWSFIRSKLNLLKDYELFNNLSHQISGDTLRTYFEAMTEIAKAINDACYSANQRNIWPDDFVLDRTGFAHWYLSESFDQTTVSRREELIEEYLQTNDPLIAFSKAYENRNDMMASMGDFFDEDDFIPVDARHVICAHPSDCARKIVESMINIYAATQYASTLWSMERKIRTPDLFNPYAERTSCGVYDPWYKTKATLFNLVWDMSQTAISTFTYGMIYTSATLPPRTVTSFNQLVEDGKVMYNVNYNRDSIFSTLSADFGPLLGIPCSISISNTNTPPRDYMLFTGISIGACQTNEDYALYIDSGSNIGENDSRIRSGCFSCSLDFESISGPLALVSRTVGPVYFFMRGMYRLYQGFSDKNNIPRSWSVNPRSLVETYARHKGEIPYWCESILRRGEQCLPNGCEKAVSTKLREEFPHLGTFISFFNVPRQGNGTVRVRGCDQDIRVRVQQRRFVNYEMDDERSCMVTRLSIPTSCREIP